jgi:hypothetical protein
MEDNMVKRKLAWLLLLLALLFSLPGFIVAAWGQDLPLRETTDEHSRRQCSQATLKGTYGDLEQGTVVMDVGFGTPPFPLAVTAIVTYDGEGNVSAKSTATFNGVTITGGATGTYTVYPDCTYSDENTPYPSGPVSHHWGTITGEELSQQVDYIYTDPWLVASGTLRKIVPWGCSSRTLKGTYEIFGHGTDTSTTIPIPGFPSPPFPLAHVGVFTADGAGHFSGHDVEKVDVAATPTTFTGTYTVDPDCTVSFTFTDTVPLPPPIGPFITTIHETGTITGWGDSQEVHVIMTDAGYVFVDTVKRQ